MSVIVHETVSENCEFDTVRVCDMACVCVYTDGIVRKVAMLAWAITQLTSLCGGCGTKKGGQNWGGI